jgi:ribosomal protein S6--L-glutamate ligase
MLFCFIIERQYRREPMPMVVADRLAQWGHQVDLLEPQAMITSLSDLVTRKYDAYVLKTVSDGPGLSILEAAEAVGIPTINNSRAIRLVRDKAVAAAVARARGLPFPQSYFVTHPRLLKQISAEDYPLIVKPSNGSSQRGIYRLESPTDLEKLEMADVKDSFFLAQRYIENTGFDIKLYVTGKEVRAVAKKSVLHAAVEEKLIPVTAALRKVALDVGKVFGLDIYGVDVLETAQGLIVVDINDFPSFGLVPGASSRVAEYILHAAKRAEMQRDARLQRAVRRRTLPTAQHGQEAIQERV